jgi:hypothetical protein
MRFNLFEQSECGDNSNEPFLNENDSEDTKRVITNNFDHERCDKNTIVIDIKKQVWMDKMKHKL